MFLVKLISLLSLSAYTQAMDQQYFVTTLGYRLDGSTTLDEVSSNDMTPLWCANMCASNCSCVMHSPGDKTCIALRENIDDSMVTLVPDSTWNLLCKKGLAVQRGQWTMVFRAQSEIGVSVYETWMSVGEQNDIPGIEEFPQACLGLNKDPTCKRHFRSQILDRWSGIEEVEFSLFTDGTKVKSMRFDGTGSTMTSWYSQSRLIWSSWPDLATDQYLGYFRLEGFVHPGQAERRFAIYYPHNGCGMDRSYCYVMDKPYESCDYYGLDDSTYPKFIYSPNEGLVWLYYEEFKYADVLAVFVKFKD